MRWPLGGRRRGRPVLPTRHPAPPAAPPTQALPPRPAGAPPASGPAPRVPAPPPVSEPAPPPPQPAQPDNQPTAPTRAVAPPPPPPVATPPSPPSPPPKEPPGPTRSAGPDADDQPATIGDVRRLRRWLLVSALWAVAATAIAVLAYLAANDDDEQRIADAGARAGAVQRRVNSQLRELDRRLANLPVSEEVTGLAARIRRLDRVTARQDKQLVSTGKELESLKERVDTVETEASQSDGDTTTTPP